MFSDDGFSDDGSSEDGSSEDGSSALPSAASLRELEARLQRALRAGDPNAELTLLGYGEISCVVAWEEGGRRWAMKRLPDFPDRASLERYRASFERYLEALDERGVTPVESALLELEPAKESDGSGRAIAWCAQPILEVEGLGPKWLAAHGEEEARALFVLLLDAIEEAAGPRLGIDGQLSNWHVREERGALTLRYLDITTPFLRDAAGKEELDLSIFMASLPWIMRPVVRRFMIKDILDKYYEPRGIVLDLLGNLYKERLDRFLPALLPLANERFASAPITAEEARAYYKRDAGDWALLQRLRKIDRAWQRHIRRKVYPFLIPGAIER